MIGKNIIFFVFIGVVWAQTEPSLSDLLSSLPPELQGKVGEAEANKTIGAFIEKCEKNGGPDAFSKVQNAGKEFTECMRNIVEPSVLQKEIEEAKPNGQVDEVFKKYCQKTPLFKACVLNMTEASQSCFTPEERANMKTIHNVSQQLADFICFKEGDRIALFIAENGPECLTEKQEEIKECVNKTMGSDIQFNPTDLNNFTLPKIQFTEKECKQLEDLQTCVVESLETCSAPTSANIIESLFKFVRKATPCKDIPEAEEKKNPNSAQGLAATSLALIAVVTSALL